MTDKEILEIFEKFKDDYAIPKSSESSRIITFFCLYINRQDLIIQRRFKDFFIRELVTNTYSYQSWAIDILMKLNDKEMILPIYNTLNQHYNKGTNHENIFITGKIFLLLVKLKDCDINHIPLYYNFVEREIKKRLFLNQDSFFLNLIVEYLAINPKHSLEILSDYYAKFISEKTTVNESNIFVPCLFFSHNACINMDTLLLMTYRKNLQSGIYLKKLFMDYAKYHPVENKEEWNNMQNMILQLNSTSFLNN